MELLEQIKSGLTELTDGGTNGSSQNVLSVVSAAMGILLSPNVGTSTVGTSDTGFSGGVAGSAVGSLINDFRSHNVLQVDSWVKP